VKVLWRIDVLKIYFVFSYFFLGDSKRNFVNVPFFSLLDYYAIMDNSDFPFEFYIIICVFIISTSYSIPEIIPYYIY
jgi:hypothetical protein